MSGKNECFSKMSGKCQGILKLLIKFVSNDEKQKMKQKMGSFLNILDIS